MIFLYIILFPLKAFQLFLIALIKKIYKHVMVIKTFTALF